MPADNDPQNCLLPPCLHVASLGSLCHCPRLGKIHASDAALSRLLTARMVCVLVYRCMKGLSPLCTTIWPGASGRLWRRGRAARDVGSCQQHCDTRLAAVEQHVPRGCSPLRNSLDSDAPSAKPLVICSLEADPVNMRLQPRAASTHILGNPIDNLLAPLLLFLRCLERRETTGRHAVCPWQLGTLVVVLDSNDADVFDAWVSEQKRFEVGRRDWRRRSDDSLQS